MPLVCSVKFYANCCLNFLVGAFNGKYFLQGKKLTCKGLDWLCGFSFLMQEDQPSVQSQEETSEHDSSPCTLAC